jgi:YVTN family beta-propeller protein
MAVSPDGKEVYVACADSEHFISRVYVINASSYAIKHQLDTLQGPRGVAFSPDGKKAFITNYYSDYVTVLDTASRSVVRTVSLGKASPNKVAVTTDGKKVYVSHGGDVNGISVINASDYSVTFIADAGKYLKELAICKVPQSFLIRPIPVTLIPYQPSPTPAATPTPVATAEPTKAPGPTATVAPSPEPTAIPEPDVTQNPAPSASPAPSATPGFGAITAIACLGGAVFLARKR